MAASTGCTRNAVHLSTWQWTLITDVHSDREPRPLDSRPQRKVHQTWQAGGGSFLLLPRWHALSSQWLWTFNHNTCENCLEEVQGAATSSLFLPPLFQDTWPCVQLLCVNAMLHASKTWPLTKQIHQHLHRNDRAMISQLCNQLQWATWPHSEGEKALLVWTCGMLQWCSRQPVTYRLMESVGLRGPRWHGCSWQRGTAESGSSQLLTLMIDIPEDLVWDLPCMQQASYREGGKLMWMLPRYRHVNQKYDDDDDDDDDDDRSFQLSTLMIDTPGDLVWDLPCSKPATWKGAHCCGCCPCTCIIKNLLLMMTEALCYRPSW